MSKQTSFSSLNVKLSNCVYMRHLSRFKKCSGGPYFPLRTAYLFINGKEIPLILYDSPSYTVTIQIWVWISSPKLHSAPFFLRRKKNTLPLSPTHGLSLWYVSKLYAPPVGAAQGESRNHRAIVSPVWRSEEADRPACRDLKKGGEIQSLAILQMCIITAMHLRGPSVHEEHLENYLAQPESRTYVSKAVPAPWIKPRQQYNKINSRRSENLLLFIYFFPIYIYFPSGSDVRNERNIGRRNES